MLYLKIVCLVSLNSQQSSCLKLLIPITLLTVTMEHITSRATCMPVGASRLLTTTKGFSPTRLVDLCIRFVAKHLMYVESFVGFPDQIGKQIFSEAVSFGMFQQQSQYSVTNMKLFCEAYEQQVLSCLNLTEHHLVVNNHLDIICLFTRLTELNLASCGLGDEHPLISYIPVVNSLLVLGLRNNALSDVGIQKLTSPIRMFQKGPMDLQKIDISDNADITIKGVLHLKVFAQLQFVDLSRTSVESLQTRSFEKDVGLIQTTRSAGAVFQVKTAGWAACIIEAWIQECRKRQKLNASKPKRPHFYGRMSRGIIQNLKPDSGHSQTEGNSSVLILTKRFVSPGAGNGQKTDGSDTFSQIGVTPLDQHPEPLDNKSKDINRTVQTNFEYAEQQYINKKRTREETNSKCDGDDDKLLMEMYSGMNSRKQRRLSDLY